MQEIRVLVPEERVADFYKWFGGWLDTPERYEPGAAAPDHDRVDWSNTPEDKELAEKLWAKLSGRAKALFGHLIDQPDARFSGKELAATLDIPNGRYGVAGILAWPGRYCLAMHRHLPIRWSDQEGAYWMEPSVAQLFAEVRGR